MKLSTVLFVATQAALAFAASPDAGAGPADDGRGTINATDLLPRDADRLEARSCWYGRSPGSSQSGYCFRNCGNNGEWCWLAADNGNGPWVKCSSDAQCSDSATHGAACGKGNCKDCGCSC